LRKGFASVWFDVLFFTTRHSKTLPQVATATHCHVMKLICMFRCCYHFTIFYVKKNSPLLRRAICWMIINRFELPENQKRQLQQCVLWAKANENFRAVVFIFLILELQNYAFVFYQLNIQLSELVNVWLKKIAGIRWGF